MAGNDQEIIDLLTWVGVMGITSFFKNNQIMYLYPGYPQYYEITVTRLLEMYREYKSNNPKSLINGKQTTGA